MYELYFSERDKQAIRENQQKLVNILGTEDLSSGYGEFIVDTNDYYRIADIAPIFEKLRDACFGCCCEEIPNINGEIQQFLRTLPHVAVELDFDTFYENFKGDGLVAFKGNLFEEGLFERLLDSSELTKEEKEKIISIVFKE